MACGTGSDSCKCAGVMTRLRSSGVTLHQRLLGLSNATKHTSYGLHARIWQHGNNYHVITDNNILTPTVVDNLGGTIFWSFYGLRIRTSKVAYVPAFACLFLLLRFPLFPGLRP